VFTAIPAIETALRDGRGMDALTDEQRALVREAAAWWPERN